MDDTLGHHFAVRI
jgi:hypothetical protein